MSCFSSIPTNNISSLVTPLSNPRFLADKNPSLCFNPAPPETLSTSSRDIGTQVIFSFLNLAYPNLIADNILIFSLGKCDLLDNNLSNQSPFIALNIFITDGEYSLAFSILFLLKNSSIIL